jgi:hypothetical protein
MCLYRLASEKNCSDIHWRKLLSSNTTAFWASDFVLNAMFIGTLLYSTPVRNIIKNKNSPYGSFKLRHHAQAHTHSMNVICTCNISWINRPRKKSSALKSHSGGKSMYARDSKELQQLCSLLSPWRHDVIKKLGDARTAAKFINEYVEARHERRVNRNMKRSHNIVTTQKYERLFIETCGVSVHDISYDIALRYHEDGRRLTDHDTNRGLHPNKFYQSILQVRYFMQAAEFGLYRELLESTLANLVLRVRRQCRA